MDISEFIKDPGWEFWAVVVAVVFGFIQTLTMHSRKQLSFGILTDSSVADVDSEVEDKIRLLYEGQDVKHVRLLEIRIWNSGNVPIVEEDFREKLVLRLPEGVQVLSARISETKPKELVPTLTVADAVTLEPTLLNDGDSMTIKLFVSGRQTGVSLSGRIVGVREINHAYSRNEFVIKAIAFGTGLKLSAILVILMTLVFFLTGLSSQRDAALIGILGGILMIAGSLASEERLMTLLAAAVAKMSK